MHSTAIPMNDFVPAPNGKPAAHVVSQRDAIGSIVDGIADEFCEKISAVRAALDSIEQRYLESAANAKVTLKDHVLICRKFNAEVEHMQAVVAEMSGRLHHE